MVPFAYIIGVVSLQHDTLLRKSKAEEKHFYVQSIARSKNLTGIPTRKDNLHRRSYGGLSRNETDFIQKSFMEACQDKSLQVVHTFQHFEFHQSTPFLRRQQPKRASNSAGSSPKFIRIWKSARSKSKSTLCSQNLRWSNTTICSVQNWLTFCGMIVDGNSWLPHTKATAGPTLAPVSPPFSIWTEKRRKSTSSDCRSLWAWSQGWKLVASRWT